MSSPETAMPVPLTWARRALWAQIALTAVAVVVTVAAPSVISALVVTDRGAVAFGYALASPLFVLGPLLICAAVAGLVAVRRDTWRLRASIVLLAPVLFVVGSGIEALLGLDPEVETATTGLPAGYVLFIELTTTVAVGAHWLALVAICCGTAAAVLLLRARGAGRPHGQPT